MPSSNRETVELTYALGAVSRLTGLSPEVLRAWERRHGVVQPLRTPGGTRRYRAADLERLRLVKAVVDAGHRIGNVAGLSDEQLRDLAGASQATPQPPRDAVIQALERLDAHEAQRLMALQLSALGPVCFAADFAAPLVREIGALWADGRLSIASEHLCTAILRSMLGSALLHDAVALRGPRIAFATPAGEHHELGTQMAALTALGSGANPIYLGADVPPHELVRAVRVAHAAALALAVVTLSAEAADAAIAEIRSGLPGPVRLWVGGAAASGLPDRHGVEYVESFDALSHRVASLGLEGAAEVRR